MKKALVLALLALGLVACGQKEEAKPAEAATTEAAAPAEETVLTYAKEDGTQVVLKSSDVFATGTLTIGDMEYALVATEAASGMQLATEDGKVSIHVKEGEGGVLTVDGVDANITEVK